MNPCESYLWSQEEPLRSALQSLHQFFLEKGLSAKMRYGIPFYDYGRWICYLNPLKDGTFELCFLNAFAFDDPSGLLQSRGRKMVKGLILHPEQDLDINFIGAILEKACTAAQEKAP